MWRKLILLSAALSMGQIAHANSDPYSIEVLSSAYGDGEGHTCSPDLSICNGRTECDFLVDDSLCTLSEDSGSARNLEVTFSCGVPLPDKAVAAARGTRITLDCQKK